MRVSSAAAGETGGKNDCVTLHSRRPGHSPISGHTENTETHSVWTHFASCSGPVSGAGEGEGGRIGKQTWRQEFPSSECKCGRGPKGIAIT